VRFSDIERAAAALAGEMVRTPTMHSRTLSAITGAEIWLKFENLQYTGSFKDRGALWRLLQLGPEERRRGVIAVSAGNHAQGVAYHATRLGVPATIVMPRSTPNVKVANTEALGARVILHGDDLSGATVEADRLATEHGFVWIAPYDDPVVIAGQGTVALELLADAPELDGVIVPVGGGGLISGIAVAVAELRPDVEVVGVETELYPSMHNALAREGVIPGGATIAEGIAVARPGRLTETVVRALVKDVMTVPESIIENAMTLLLEIEKTVVEGAGAAPLAAVLSEPERFKDRRVGLILSGGNIDARTLASVIMRGLVRSGRLSRLSVSVTDAPGSLSRVTGIIGALDGNIVEVYHQRLFSDLSVKSATLELAIETRDSAHSERIVAALERDGYRVMREEHA
jgi:threonine dehydratase